jgi:hypothetical protein
MLNDPAVPSPSPAAAVQALRGWQDTGLVFTSHLGAALDAANVRKMFKRICAETGAGTAGPRANSGPPSSA